MEPDSLPLVDLPMGGSDDDYVPIDEDEVAGEDADDVQRDKLVVQTEGDSDNLNPEEDLEAESDESSDEEVPLKRSDLSQTRQRSQSEQPFNFNTANRSDYVTHRRSSVGNWIRKKLGSMQPSNRKINRVSKSVEDQPEHEIVYESLDYVSPDYQMESVGDLSFCPGFIELHDSKKEGRSKLYFVLVKQPSFTNSYDSSTIGYDTSAPRIRLFKDIMKTIPLVPIPKLHKNQRLSLLEKRRRQVAESYRALMQSDNVNVQRKLNLFLNNVTDTERSFLGGNNSISEKSKNGILSWEGDVALATSSRHYLEQYMCLSR